MKMQSLPSDQFCFNAARSILCGATYTPRTFPFSFVVSMPHAAFYVVQQHVPHPLKSLRMFQCRTQHFMWCNIAEQIAGNGLHSFNAARSILCGATSPPRRKPKSLQFQCRTQHFMWCNIDDVGVYSSSGCFNAARSILCGATTKENISPASLMFQCRTQHFMWCNSVARSPCPARGERAFWKVVDFLCRFPLMGRNFHRKITASIGAFPCAAQGCAKMENRDGRMRLCGIAVAFSTFLHHGCIISENP